MRLYLLILPFILLACTPQQHRRDTNSGQAAATADDEAAIRAYYAKWMKATKEGDLALARSLIKNDAVFFVPGGHQMDKDSFAQAATASAPHLEFELDTSIEDITIIGDHAWLVTKLSLAITDKNSKQRTEMAGHALSILARHQDSWVVVREANTMIAVDKKN